MRNGKTLLRWMVAMPVVTMACTCLILTGRMAHATGSALEPTESGAPSAMVLFPVTERPDVKTSMRPVVFNHLIHEKKVENCETCHHTGDPAPCTSCHTVEGKAEGNYITLDRAMHAENIAPRKDGVTPSSCVSCHQKNLKRRECAGCHSIVKPTRGDAYCAVCHNVTSKMTKEQLELGMKDQLPMAGELAAETVAEKKPVQYIDPASIPLKVTIDGLKDKYEGNTFMHARHVSSLMRRIADDKLAGAFHTNPETLCTTCHHNSPLSANPPKCSSCHAAKVDTKTPDPGRPGLKAAYHLQCIGCHTGMNVARPRATDCTTCHKDRAM